MKRFTRLSTLLSAASIALLFSGPAQAADSTVDAAGCLVHPGTLTIYTGVEWPLAQAPCLVIQGDLDIRHEGAPPMPLVAVHGSVKVKRFDGPNLEMLRGLKLVGRNLEIEHSHNLQNLSGLEDLESVGLDLEIEDNHQLQNIDALSNLKSVGEDLQIENNTVLASIAGLRNLERVAKDLQIENNHQLQTLGGLEQLTFVGGDFEIENNSRLQSLDALQRLQSVGGDFELKSNPQLQNLQGLRALQSVGKDVEIQNNQVICQSDAQALATRLNKPTRKVVRNRGRCN